MRYDSEHKARTRERLLTEAAALVRQAGPERLGIATVMARAGLTHGGFYAHFRSRDELLTETVGHMTQRHRMVQGAGFREGEDLRRQFRRYVRGYLSWAHCQERESGCPIPLLVGEAERLPEAARTHYAAGFERLVGGLAASLERLGMDPARARPVAQAGAAEMVGAVALARAQPDRTAAEALLEVVRASVLERFGLAREESSSATATPPSASPSTSAGTAIADTPPPVARSLGLKARRRHLGQRS